MESFTVSLAHLAYLDDAPEVTSPLECFSPDDSDDLQQVMDPETFAFISENAFEVDRMVCILKVLLDTALDLQKATDNCLKQVILKASEGIKFLPDELLALIHCSQPRWTSLRGGGSGAAVACLPQVPGGRFGGSPVSGQSVLGWGRMN